MASIIRIKRSSGTNKPASLQWGELGYVTGIGSYGGLNQYKDRVFLGDDGTNANPVGGFYYTSMMEHEPGVIPAASHNSRNQDRGVVAIMAPATNSGLGGAESLKVNQWNVDNLRIDGNVISSTDTDGDIRLDPHGTGEVVIPDDTFLTFGDDDDARIEYDEDASNRVQVTGAPWTWNTPITVNGESIFGNVRIDNNVIATLPGTGDTLFIDPYPDGLSNEGKVIIKGDLQVDGTTTTVNSTSSTVNDPILHVGDVTSERTVMQTVNSGDSVIVLDSVVGINVGDIIAHTSISGGTSINNINTGTKAVTLDSNVIAGISTTSQVTITHAVDTNTDRGISFAYNTSTGVVNNKLGFFGFEDSSIASSASNANTHGTHGDDSRRWTYIPDGTINNSVVTGTKGFLDIRGIYYQTGDYETGGVVYFDGNGLQRSTNAPTAPTFTSKQVLTAITKKDFSLTASITASAGDIIRQDGTNAYGIVETGVSGANNVSLIGIEGTFATGQNLRREGVNGSITNLASNPVSITDIYNNKPHWTSTLDGGTF
ncbi:MAG: hypothetical protein CL983_01095 [Euryarchaeota archaeon]|nr:hypothetical protein [Euryarchaeota archaeon]